MKIESFFKPTKYKIIIALLIPLYLTYSVQYARVINGPEIFFGYIINFIPLLIYVPIILYGHFFTIYATPLSGKLEYLTLFLETVVPLLINYIIACIIILLFKKYKK